MSHFERCEKGSISMKKRLVSTMAVILVAVMLLGVLASCGTVTPEVTTEEPDIVTTEPPVESTNNESGEDTTEGKTEQTSEANTEGNSEEATEKTPEEVVEGPYADTIIAANKLMNGVQDYYDGLTNYFGNNGYDYYVHNQQIDMLILRDNATKDQYVGYIKNKDGGVYIENTLDAYIRMEDGSVFYTSKTTNDSYTDVTKHGYYYHEVRIERLNFANDAGKRIEKLQVASIYHTYSDKLHHELQVCSTRTDTTGIAAIGFVTEISADKVSKLQIKDKNGTHDSLDKIDWASAEYVGFDITDAGIFGYILPVHENSGTLTVTLEGGKYIIVQEAIPADGTVKAGNSEVLNGNDFCMGHRLYTDPSHDFAGLEVEAYVERNPLTAKNIKLSTALSDQATFAGYDALRGSYIINMAYKGRDLWNKRQNLHFEANFSVRSDKQDRLIYMVVTEESGSLPTAVVLDENLMYLPIPVQVGKNFNDGDDKNNNISADSNTTTHNVFNYADKTYGEAIVPIVAKSDSVTEYSVIHLYQNWGNFPLKQISSIHFYKTYYHMSTGLTESNCLIISSSLINNLPDHRPMSAPYWAEGIQHTSGGFHNFLNYSLKPGTDVYALEHRFKYINSSGPIYSDIDMIFESSDGKVNATISHIEMPQTDENRAYYTFKYEIVEDLSINGFKKTATLYSVYSKDNSGKYARFGYLNENNESAYGEFDASGKEKFHTLGSDAPYFDLFYMPTYSGGGGTGYVNVAFLVKDYKVVIDGKETDVALLIREQNNKMALTLDLDKVKFKAGDSITINAIIMPWGSQESDYSGKNYAPDQNVLDVRENSILNPVHAVAGESCEVVDHTFIPMVKTTNGESLTFTLSGGKKNQHVIMNRGEGHNIAVRVYGFEKLGVPKVYEVSGCELFEYELSSINTPDVAGYTNQYDGYAVYYEPDGTYSYAFVIDMTEGKDRTFRVELDGEFKGFARVETVENVLNPYNVLFDHSQVAAAAKRSNRWGKYANNSESGLQFVSLYGTEKTNESTAIFTPDAINGAETGQYIFIKYRLPKDNALKIDYIQVYTSTTNTSPTGAEVFDIKTGIESDGEWHVMVIDTQGQRFGGKSDCVKADANGDYYIKHMRLDLINSSSSEATRWDIAFCGFDDDLQTILEANSDMEYITLVTGPTVSAKIDPKTGENID